MSIADQILTRLPRPAAVWSRVFGLGIIVGVVGGLAAAGLEWGLHHGSQLLVGRFTHLGGAATMAFRWEVLLLPAVGGLMSGIVVRLLCPATTGHGTNLLVRAFHRGLGNLPLLGPLVKAVASIGVISCGGSAGPEGPTAALGAAIGSTCGRLFGLTPRERRMLLVAGCAAGVGAIFRCPLGGALFAAGVLYREPEFESEAIVTSVVASVIAYSAYMLVWGFGEFMLKGATTLVFDSPLELIPYAVLGPLCGAAAICFGLSMRLVEGRLVPWSKLPSWFLPTLGGLATGALACCLPQVMDGQYRFVQNAMDGSIFAAQPQATWWTWAGLFGAVALVKCLATAFTVGSGASGGVLGPSVFIGGAAGAFLGAVCQALLPGTYPETLRMALIPVGMGGVLAATMRTPLAAIVMVTEMTGSYGLIVPLMLVCVSAYVVGRRWGLNDEQVRSSAESPAHAADAVIHLLESCRVEQLMERDWAVAVPPNARLRNLVERIKPGTRPVFAVVDGGRLAGLISVPDIEQIMEEPALADAVIASDIMTDRLDTVHPDEDIYRALTKFAGGNHVALPVVSRDRRRRWMGMLTRERVFETIRQNAEQTQKQVLREHGGLAAIDQEGRLQQLVMGVLPERRDMVQRLIVPLQAVGKSLREADFRRQFGAQVIAIERPDGSIQCPPDLDAPLQTSHRLVAVVWSREKDASGPDTATQ